MRGMFQWGRRAVRFCEFSAGTLVLPTAYFEGRSACLPRPAIYMKDFKILQYLFRVPALAFEYDNREV
jgi:hypothetical protein